MTVRDRIRVIQLKLRDGALTPEMARDSLVSLTALSGNVADELRAAETDYRVVLLACFESEQKANRARMRAEVSPEYGRYRSAKDTQDLTKQMIITCRAYLRSLDEEMRLQR